MATSSKRFIAGAALCLAAALLAGCGSPPSSLELIGVAQKALTDAAQYQQQRHQEAVANLDSLQGSLDAAFDADARLVESGKLADADGKPVALNAAWVISARKGYAAARDALAQQRQKAEAAHATQLDNLTAANEALDLSRGLIIQSSSISAQAKQMLMDLERRFVHGK